MFKSVQVSDVSFKRFNRLHFETQSDVIFFSPRSRTPSPLYHNALPCYHVSVIGTSATVLWFYFNRKSASRPKTNFTHTFSQVIWFHSVHQPKPFSIHGFPVSMSWHFFPFMWLWGAKINVNITNCFCCNSSSHEFWLIRIWFNSLPSAELLVSFQNVRSTLTKTFNFGWFLVYNPPHGLFHFTPVVCRTHFGW